MAKRFKLTNRGKARKGIDKSKLYKKWADGVNLDSLMIAKSQSEDQIDTFSEFEEELAAFLGGVFLASTESEVDLLVSKIEAEEFDFIGFSNTVNSLDNKRVVSPDDRAALQEFFGEVLDTGVVESDELIQRMDLAVEEQSFDNQSVSNFSGSMTSFTEYYANNYPGRVLGPSLLAAAAKFESGQLAKDEFSEFVRNKFTENPYWQTVSNTGTVKAYHYGYLKNMEASGIEEYTYKAILDSKTTPICRHLNGKVFNVRRGLELLENFSGSTASNAPSELPWLSKEEQEDIVTRNLTKEELQAQGVILPGSLHANCRSTLVSTQGRVINARSVV